MEHTKKMILIEPRVLESLQGRDGPPVPDATTQNLKEKSRSIEAILDSDQNVHDKANAYQQALWSFLNRFEQYKDRPLGKVQLTSDSKLKEETPEDDSGTSVERDVIQSVPKSMKNKAERLLQRLKSHPDVKWNSLGEFEFEGQLIKNSNLTDLVNDVLRKRRSADEPLGWETFAKALRTTNVPRDLIGNPSRWSYVRRKGLYDTSRTPGISPRNVAMSSAPQPPVTPRRWKKSTGDKTSTNWISL